MPPKSTQRKAVPPPGTEKDFEILESDMKWDFVKMLLYGPPGIGKTWLCGTAVQVKKMCPVLLIDNDGGSKTVRGKSQFKGIKIFRVYQFPAYNKIYEMLQKAPDMFGTVIIDNLGAVHTLAMDLEMESVVGNDPSRELHVPSMREYGIVRAQIRKLLKFFSELPCNLIVTAHAELDKDELSGMTRVRPALAGKLAYEVPGNLDIVGYLTTQRISKGGVATKKTDIQRVAMFQPQGKIEVKDESDTLGALLPDPTFEKIVRLIKLT